MKSISMEIIYIVINAEHEWTKRRNYKMQVLIDLDTFMDNLSDEIAMGISDIYEAVGNALAATPLISAESIRRGNWCDYIADKKFCSECEYEENILYNYCPDYGIKMNRRDDNGTEK